MNEWASGYSGAFVTLDDELDREFEDRLRSRRPRVPCGVRRAAAQAGRGRRRAGSVCESLPQFQSASGSRSLSRMAGSNDVAPGDRSLAIGSETVSAGAVVGDGVNTF